MDKEFAALYESLTKEGQEKLINTVMSFASAEDIIDGIYKEAKEKKVDKKKVAVGAGAATVGGALVKNQFEKGHMTGRETLYHNTRKKNIKKIKEKGILASKASDPKNHTHQVLTDVPEDQLKGKVYLGRNKMTSHAVGQAALKNSMMKKVMYKTRHGRKNLSLGEAIKLGLKSNKERGTVKAKMPLWKNQQHLSDNPEMRGAKTHAEWGDVLKKKMPLLGMYPEKAQSHIIKSTFKTLHDNTVTLNKDVSPKYIKGSKHYQRAGLKEVGEYIKANPKRFTKGAGKVGAGLAVAGAGASLVHNAFKKKASDEIDDVFFKHAKMTIPTPAEAKEEKTPPQKDDRPKIDCEVCDYNGVTTAQGRCPECGAIMGVKPDDYPIPYTPIWTGEPMSGISVNEADTRGRMEDVW
jgi:rubrerythrin